MVTDGQVEVATWKTDRTLTVTQAAGAAWRIGLRAGHRIHMVRTEDPALGSSFGSAQFLGAAHTLVLDDRTVSWEVADGTRLWKVILSPDRAADGSLSGVIGAAWCMSGAMAAMDSTQRPAGLRSWQQAPERTVPTPSPPASSDLDLLLSRLPVAVLKVSAQDTVLGANPAAATLFGSPTPDGLSGLPLRRLTRDGFPGPADDAEVSSVPFVRLDGAEFLADCVRIPWQSELTLRELLMLGEAFTVLTDDGLRTPARRPALTPTEASILELTAQGLTSSQIASRLHFSRNNVEYHLGNLRFRIGGGNRVALIARAYAQDLLRRGTWPPAVTAGHPAPAPQPAPRPAPRATAS
ncbi:LuxR C-terminal-related transcriptional regulator [Streptomyces acidiscabies]|uniref:helix-turn-helix transcriptional regulator n=1 Tax=Streptomyces acidiscabies TaxID=42234 RepID=UPI0038F7D624